MLLLWNITSLVQRLQMQLMITNAFELRQLVLDTLKYLNYNIVCYTLYRNKHAKAR